MLKTSDAKTATATATARAAVLDRQTNSKIAETSRRGDQIRHSCIYEGTVRHRRRLHADNQFKFAAFMFLLDLDELETVFEGHWFWSTKRFAYGSFRRTDFLKEFDSTLPLKKCVIDFLRDNGIEQPVGRVSLLTQLRYCGFQMNPVSFYYCYSAAEDENDREEVVAIIAEVNNTPWGEQHLYFVPADHGGMNRPRQLIKAENIKKSFHVSPFMDLDMHYRMLFSLPGEKIAVKMENHQRDQKIFDVSLALARKPINSWQLFLVAIKYPLYSFKVFAGIYFQALKLFLKRVPYFAHPGST